MQLRSFFKIGAGGLSVVFLGVVAAGAIAIEHVRIGGPESQKIQAGNDYVADIAPPPVFLVEANLHASRAVLLPQNVVEETATLAQLEKDYTSRFDHWMASDLSSAVKQQLMKTVDPPARQFWRNVDTELLPAVRRGDSAAAQAAYGRLEVFFEQHRKAVVDSLATQSDLNATSVAKTDATVRKYEGALVVGCSCCLAASSPMSCC